MYATNLFQIPIVVVSPGPEPVTRCQRMTMIDSGHELKLHPDDFQNFERQSYPIVIAWNGHNHFVPTCVMSDIQHNQWKLKELTILTEASLKVISDINPGKCTDAQRVHLEVLKDNMELSRTLFAPHTSSTYSIEETSAGARPRPRPTSTPLFTNVPDAPGNVSHHHDSPSSAIIRNGKHSFLCDICGLEKTKTSDLLDHLSVKHKLGSPIVCKECKKNFTTKRSLKQHMRTQHQGNFKYNCEQHNWHSDNKAVYENHMVTKHGAAKEGLVSDYKCKKCEKDFTGKHLLANHIHRGTCNLPKNFSAHFATGTLKQRLILHMSTLNSSIYKL